MADPGCDAVILLAHGARDARWREPFERMRASVAAGAPGCTVALAYLEFSPPTLGEATAALAGAGVTRVLVVPVFLSGGGHVARDVGALVEAERARFPAITFESSGALGEEPEVAGAMAEAVRRLIGG